MSFRDKAQSATSISFITEGRNKVKTDEIIRRYPQGITVIGFDLINTKDKKGADIILPAILIAEDTSVFFFGGAVLNKICQEWVKDYDGDCKAASYALEAEGGVKMQLTKGTTKEGNTVTNVTIL